MRAESSHGSLHFPMVMMDILSILFWDPSREVFSHPLPLLNRPILWYGVFFALGVFLAFLAFRMRFKPQGLSDKERKKITDKLLLYVLVGVVLGARIGDLLFYQSFQENLSHPWEMIQFWKGGLASHGAAIGAILALYLFSKRYTIYSFLELLDAVCVVAPLAGAFIRLGNFMNQEILGTVTSVPWAVVFGHPIDGSAPVARHPVQLYEALFYFAMFLFLFRFSRKKRPKGELSGLFFVHIFVFRFLIEFMKEEQSAYLSSTLTMGQLLSIPFILLGFAFLWISRKKRMTKN